MHVQPEKFTSLLGTEEGIQLILVDRVYFRHRYDSTFIIQHMDTELPRHTGFVIEWATSLH